MKEIASRAFISQKVRLIETIAVRTSTPTKRARHKNRSHGRNTPGQLVIFL
jgi:hypothetical protein